MCAKALAAMPAPGEDSLEIAAPCIAHVESRCTELVAGFAGERLAGYAADGEVGSSDLAIAQIYAATVAAPSAIKAYLDFCRASATAILKDHWPAVLALAAELDKRGTIDGAGIDRIIEEAEFEVVRAAELSRRGKWAEIAERAALFEKNLPVPPSVTGKLVISRMS